MKTIEKIDIKVSYSVILEDFQVPDDLYDKIMEVYDSRNTLSPNYWATRGFEDVLDFLQSSVSEDQSHHFELEIDDLETEEQ